MCMNMHQITMYTDIQLQVAVRVLGMADDDSATTVGHRGWQPACSVSPGCAPRMLPLMISDEATLCYRTGTKQEKINNTNKPIRIN
jgi:hypothetical protein